MPPLPLALTAMLPQRWRRRPPRPTPRKFGVVVTYCPTPDAVRAIPAARRGCQVWAVAFGPPGVFEHRPGDPPAPPHVVAIASAHVPTVAEMVTPARALFDVDRAQWIAHLDAGTWRDLSDLDGPLEIAELGGSDGSVALDAIARIPSVFTALVSVVMTAHNEEPLIGQAIESVLAQTHRELELIIVDDASTDSTAEVVASYQRRDSRVRLVRLVDNIGLFPARNRGLAAAQGEFVTFQDADDISRVDRIAICLRAIANADVVVGQFVRTTGDGRVVAVAGGPRYQEGIITMFFRRALLGGRLGYFDSLTVGADSEYLERMRWLGLREAVLPDVLYYARLRENSLTTKPGALAIYATTGEAHDSSDMRTYVAAYRQHHLGMKRLAMPADADQREFAVPWQCLAGAQRKRLAALCPWLTAPTPAPVVRAAEQLVVRQAAYGGNSPASLFFACDDTAPATAITASRRPHFAAAILANFARQRYRGKRLVWIMHAGGEPPAIPDELRSCVQFVAAPADLSLGACLNLAIDHAAPGPILKLDDDDYYAPDYMREQVSVLRHVGGLVGKFPIFYRSTDLTLHLRPRDRASTVRSKHVAGSTLTFDRDLWAKFRFDPALTLGEDRDLVLRIQRAGLPITATTIFNHVAIRHGDAHTWPAADRELFAPEMAEPLGTCSAPDEWPSWVEWALNGLEQ